MSANWISMLSFRGLVFLQTVIAVTWPLSAGADPFADLEADVAIDQELDSMRGGFTSTDGLEISIGVEQAVFIDGILQVVTNLSTLPITSMLQQQVDARDTNLVITQRLNLLQSDFSTITVNAEGMGSRLDTIIQNSGDQRVIDSITMINASVSSLALFRELNFLDTLQQQQIDTLR